MKKKDLLIILIPTSIFVFLWIIFNIYHNSVTSTISSNQIMQISPINPSFDTKTINLLKQRGNVVPFYQNATPSSKPIPTPIPQTPILISTQSATATSGGILNP